MKTSRINPFVNIKLLIVLLLATVCCLVVAELMQNKTNTNMYSFLAWDIFLAWVPIFFSIAITFLYNSSWSLVNKLLVFILGVGWLFFLPNAAYLFTEMIHSFRYFERQGEEIFWDDMPFWYSLTLAFVTALIGLILSTYTIHQMSQLVSNVFNKYMAGLFIVITMFLSSIGVYIGRFNRWNSWDILDEPELIIKEMVWDWYVRSSMLIKFVLLLFLVQLFCYLIIRTFSYNSKKEEGHGMSSSQ
ncbi:DUF1361 domain-containing protein [Paenibacillus sp. GSMTC-2017]|uniref:DUF1361 domain-containing protein n=1 Tax=Paenibacillus sp. GSMTC-2017 TaxID=2794350 RepID=UPI0018D82FEF|nr:DUF1361 domain-containing protein [Paenibacillus sp. GSMTC-2017]MBH5317716.1 DUF1361 domain-containing protein [Paenibacillus sp. GSMTC-2017]